MLVYLSHYQINSSSVSIVNGYGLEEQDKVPDRDMNFSLRPHAQTGSAAQPAPYPIGTGGSFPDGRVPEA
jgi:hypothetical protein